MAINLTAESERILDEIVSRGDYPSRDEALTVALKLLQNSKHGESNGAEQSVEEWVQSFEQWMSSVPKGSVNAKFDRETIYEGRD